MSLETFMQSMKDLVAAEFVKKERVSKYRAFDYLDPGMILETKTWGLLEYVRYEVVKNMFPQYVFKNEAGDEYKFTAFQLTYQHDDLYFAMKEREHPKLFKYFCSMPARGSK